MAKMQAGDRLVMVGDSITDAGRERPQGRAPYGLGNGYAALTHAMLTVEHSELAIEVRNMGIGGDTSRHISQRWQTGVMALKPQWISLMIGVNDVWRKFDHPESPELHVPLPVYQDILRTLVASTVAEVQGFLLISPFVLDLDRSDPMRTMVDEYRQSMKEIAREFSLPFYDTQEMFDGWMRDHHTPSLSPDRVHPTLFGHYLLARGLMATIAAADWL